MDQMKITPMQWDGQFLILIDQRKLPFEELYVINKSIDDVFISIKEMVVRGAPLIGFSGIWGLVLYLKNVKNISFEDFERAANYLNSARPTAVNLGHEIGLCLKMARTYFDEKGTSQGLDLILENFGHKQMKKIYNHNLLMAKLALKELDERLGKKKYRLMTLCNTGALACGPMGTALGVMTHAWNEGRVEKVFASETRPYLQGARLTAFELSKLSIPHDIVVEGAASYLLRNKMVDAIFVGADRIASNGDTANKIGTSTLSIVANHYNVPFYVVAPTSSFDLNILSGEEIDIELRDPLEVLTLHGQRIAPYESSAFNPSFDVTDSTHITAIFCENGKITDYRPDQIKKVVYETQSGH